MKRHADIVRAYGASALRAALASRGVSLSPGTPQRWADRDSIPVQYWPALVDLGVATLEDLVKGVTEPSAGAESPSASAGVQEDARPFVRETAETSEEEVRRDRMLRRAALEAFFARAEQGQWRSVEPYGPRDELYDR